MLQINREVAGIFRLFPSSHSRASSSLLPTNSLPKSTPHTPFSHQPNLTLRNSSPCYSRSLCYILLYTADTMYQNVSAFLLPPCVALSNTLRPARLYDMHTYGVCVNANADHGTFVQTTIGIRGNV